MTLRCSALTTISAAEESGEMVVVLICSFDHQAADDQRDGLVRRSGDGDGEAIYLQAGYDRTAARRRLTHLTGRSGVRLENVG